MASEDGTKYPQAEPPRGRTVEQQVLRTLSRIEGKVDGLYGEISQHGQRLATLEEARVNGTADHKRVEGQGERLEAAVAALGLQLQHERDAWRDDLHSERDAWTTALQNALKEDREAWAKEVADVHERVVNLEQGADRMRGAAWAVGIIWTIVVATPGLIALWFQLAPTT